jgi:4-hydroxybenzoate polyprenyltransferase
MGRTVLTVEPSERSVKPANRGKPATRETRATPSLTVRLNRWLELVRFSHTIFALPFAILATLFAYRVPMPDGTSPPLHWRFVVGVLVCMVAARTAAMAFNRLVDAPWDAANPRTQSRHLPAGLVQRHEVIGLIILSTIIFVTGSLCFLPNRVPVMLSLPVLAWLLGYSYAKRFTNWAHAWLGLALGLAPCCAWLAIRGQAMISHPSDLLPALQLGLAVAFWVTGFDIIYACQDESFDRQAGLHSVPSRYGTTKALRIAAISHGLAFLSFALWPIVAPSLGLGIIYAIGLTAVGLLLAYQHWIVRPDDLSRVGIAFFQVNAIISLGLTTLAAIDGWW